MEEKGSFDYVIIVDDFLLLLVAITISLSKSDLASKIFIGDGTWLKCSQNFPIIYKLTL